MDWNVKNAVNRDVERQHLNKILKEIRGAVDELEASVAAEGGLEDDVRQVVAGMVENNTEHGITVIYNTDGEVLDFIVNDFTINLSGDVTGEADVVGLRDINITTTLDPSLIGIPEAPIDGYPYWRYGGEWQQVTGGLEQLEELIENGFTVKVYDDGGGEHTWIMRQIDVDAGELTVTNGDGVLGNPTLGLADVTPGPAGVLKAFDTDQFGRVDEMHDVTITGTANQIDVANGTAAAGNPTISLADLADSGTGTFKLITRDTKGRVAGSVDGDATDVPYDNTASGLTATDVQAAIDEVEVIADGAVQSVVAGTNISVDNTDPQNPVVSASGGGTGTVTSVAVADTADITWTGSPITTTGTFTPTLSTNLQAWSGIATASKLDTSVYTAADVLAKILTVDGPGSGLNADQLEGLHGNTAAVGNTVVVRDSSADIHARLFRSGYNTTNSNINLIMTQVDTTSNNYIRPSTPAQLLTALGIASGTYTPATTNSTNVVSSTAFSMHYQRVGDIVNIAGRAEATPSVSGATSIFEIALPIASNFSASTDAAGSGSIVVGTTRTGVTCDANITSDRLRVVFLSASTGVHAIFFNASYRII